MAAKKGKKGSRRARRGGKKGSKRRASSAKRGAARQKLHPGLAIAPKPGKKTLSKAHLRALKAGKAAKSIKKGQEVYALKNRKAGGKKGPTNARPGGGWASLGKAVAAEQRKKAAAEKRAAQKAAERNRKIAKAQKAAARAAARARKLAGME